jgi:HEAT repeat protein
MMSNLMLRDGIVPCVRATITALGITAVACLNSAIAQAPKPKPAKADAPARDDSKKSDVDKILADKTPPENPAVTAIVATKPTTPEECVRAAKILFDFDRADLAKGFLKKVLDENLERQQLADLGEQLGPSVFLDMGDRPTLQPEAKRLANAVMAAVKARLEDSGRITALIQQLQDPSAEKRLQAIIGLQKAREAAIGPLIAVLADPARAAEHANVRAALAEMGRVALPPLLAIVEQGDAKVAVEAIRALGATKDARVAPCLLRCALSDKSDAATREAAIAALGQLNAAAPSRADAVRLLVREARDYFERHGVVEDTAAAGSRAELWRWDATRRQCVARVGTLNDLARAVAADRARDAYVLAPDNPSARLLYLATMLEQAAYENGLDRPWDEKNPAAVEAGRFSVRPLQEVLKYAMACNRPASAAAAARLLGQIGTATQLLYHSAGPSSLSLAMQSPDRRVRMAALQAIVRLQPTRSFAGSSYVLPALGFIAASGGSRHALVAAPSLVEARELAGMLATAGFTTDTFTNGRELALRGAQSPDYELALIDVTIDRPTIGILLQQLRHDARTASLRVGLIAREGHLREAERLAESDPLTKAFSLPHDDASFRWQLEQLSRLAPRDFVGFDVRQRQAAEALGLLAELARSSGNLYDLRSVQKSVVAATHNPKVAAKAVGVLAEINSAESQQTLVDLASRSTSPLALRQAAAKAFRQNTQRHGILLTSEEIRRQYQRYDESEKLDPGTQHVLGLILDCLEVNAPKKK